MQPRAPMTDRAREQIQAQERSDSMTNRELFLSLYDSMTPPRRKQLRQILEALLNEQAKQEQTEREEQTDNDRR